MTTKKDAFIIIGIYFLILIFTSLFGELISPLLETAFENEAFTVTFNTSLNLIIYLILALLYIFIFRKSFKNDVEQSINESGKTIKYIIIGFGMMILFVILNSILYQIINVTETSNNQESLDNLFVNGRAIDLIFLVIFTVILAPIVEEIVFRKAIMAFFKSVPVLSIFLSGFMFGFIHVTSGDYIQIIYYMTLGFVLGFFYYKSNYNIIVPIVIHLLFNGFLVFLMFLGI